MAQIFNRLSQLGLGIALAGGVVNSALYNGMCVLDVKTEVHCVPSVLIWFDNFVSTVDGGHRAVIFDRFAGIKQAVVGEGTHFFIPWVQRPIVFDIRSQPRNVPVVTGSKDLQNVNITLRILFRPKPDQLPRIYTILGVDYDDRVLPSITTEVLKAVVAQFDASEMITQREVIISSFFFENQQDICEELPKFKKCSKFIFKKNVFRVKFADGLTKSV